MRRGEFEVGFLGPVLFVLVIALIAILACWVANLRAG